MDYIVRITIPYGETELEEHVAALLFLSPSTGSTTDERGEGTVVEAWFGTPEERDQAARAMAAIEGVEIATFDRESVDWLDHYQQSLQAIEVGGRWIVAPDAALVSGSEREPIVIPQERAFGTGSHESTALCLEMLERIEHSGAECVDVGTGSAILAIAMAKLGARRVVAFDNDVDILGVVARNLRRNGVSSSLLQHFVGTLDAVRPRRSFRVATMNILPDVIVPLLAPLRPHLAARADVVVSGILLQQRQGVVDAAAREGYELVDETSKGEWWCGRMRLAGVEGARSQE